MWKEVSNTLYGKMAQEIKERKLYDATERISYFGPVPDLMRVLCSSCTGLVRAATAAIDVYPATQKAARLSATTDGFHRRIPLARSLR